MTLDQMLISPVVIPGVLFWQSQEGVTSEGVSLLTRIISTKMSHSHADNSNRAHEESFFFHRVFCMRAKVCPRTRRSFAWQPFHASVVFKQPV